MHLHTRRVSYPFLSDIVNIYRKPSIHNDELFADLRTVISHCMSGSIIFAGDFNIDFLKSSVPLLTESPLSFIQVITSLITPQGSLLDHVYVKGVSVRDSAVYPQLFSDHFLTYVVCDKLQ